MSHAMDRSEFYKCTTQRASKRHRCGACREVIAKGHSYKRWFTVTDGSVSVIKQCIRCHQIFEAICDMSPKDPVMFDLDCGESWGDVFGECPPGIEALAFAIPLDFVGVSS